MTLREVVLIDCQIKELLGKITKIHDALHCIERGGINLARWFHNCSSEEESIFCSIYVFGPDDQEIIEAIKTHLSNNIQKYQAKIDELKSKYEDGWEVTSRDKTDNQSINSQG